MLHRGKRLVTDRRYTNIESVVFLGLLVLCSSIQPAYARGGSGAPVSVVEAVEQPIYRQVQITGTATSPRVARLSAAISGQVLKLAVDVGAQVNEGEVLLELDAELARLNLRSFEARAEQARLAVQDAERRLTEARALIKQRSIAETRVKDLQAEVVEDSAVLQQAEAEVSHQRALLKRYVLRAPFAGVVSRKLTELGEWVNPGDAVFELVATRGMRVDFSVSEDYLQLIETGTRLSFSLSAEPDRVYQAEVDTIVPVTEPGARTFLLRTHLQDDQIRIIPGMSVRAKLRIATGRNGIVVPRDATLRHADGRITLWTVEEGEQGLQAREHLVQTGHQFDGLIEVRTGLDASARVVVQGNESLQDGQAVSIYQPSQANID